MAAPGRVQSVTRKNDERLLKAYELGWRDIHSLEIALFWRDVGSDPEIERVKVMVYEDIERQRRDMTT